MTTPGLEGLAQFLGAKPKRRAVLRRGGQAEPRRVETGEAGPSKRSRRGRRQP